MPDVDSATQTETTAMGAAIRADMKARLQFGRLQPLETAQRAYFADIPAGTIFETICQPVYWTHFAQQIRPDDMIRARCEDGTWMADLLVMFVSPTEVVTKVYQHKKFDSVAETAMESDSHVVQWKGPGLKFCIVHKRTGAIIQDRLYPKDRAVAFLSQHLRRLAS